MSTPLSLKSKTAAEELLNAIWKLPEEAQLFIADKVKQKTLRARFNNFIKSTGKKPEITMDEIVAEVKAVRAARYARRKK